MPGKSPAGYQPLSQGIEEEEDIDESVQTTSSVAPRGGRRVRPGSIDLSKLDNAFKRWTESIAQKVKRKKKAPDVHSKKTIYRSVFGPTVPPMDPPPGIIKTLDHKRPMTQGDFDLIVQSVKRAIDEGIHPKMITKGSSGSYFARAKLEDGRVQTVAVFKPKDEEPYGNLNPKTTKWIHRKFKWIIPFGRACLIPNLSYISEAAASLLDERLSLYIVPRTELASFSSPAFFYDWLDITAAKKGKPLPDKIGSLQYFLHGYQDASEFLRKHPWPGRAIADTFDDSSHRQGSLSKRMMNTLKIVCGKTGDVDDLYDDYDDVLFDETEEDDSHRPFYWTQLLQKSFREELEKLVILDYLMLNTDRGADNYMIKYCEADHEKPLVDVAPSRSARLPKMERKSDSGSPRMDIPPSYNIQATSSSGTSTPHGSDYTHRPHIHIAAIDNSLSFPHEFPKGWRSYTFGWLYLPVSIIGRPFSQHTRDHFLPLLTSKTWWEETTYELEKLFAVDPDFHPKMFGRQLAVIKGQAWNIVQSLKHADEGPLELTRRVKVLVWDDELEVDEEPAEEMRAEPSSPRLSINSVPLPPRRRRSTDGEFPPLVMRTSADASGAPRPVPFVAKFQRIHPGTTGVTVLEHLERLDAVEASLQKLAAKENGENYQEDEEEGEEDSVDVVESTKPSRIAIPQLRSPNVSTSVASSNAFSPPGSPPMLATVHEALRESSGSPVSSIDEEDLVAMSKSTSMVEGPSNAKLHSRWPSQTGANIDWFHTSDTAPKKLVIVERLETVDTKPLLSCW